MTRATVIVGSTTATVTIVALVSVVKVIAMESSKALNTSKLLKQIVTNLMTVRVLNHYHLLFVGLQPPSRTIST